MKRFAILLFLAGCFLHTMGQTLSSKLKITHLTGNFYIYTTYNSYEGSLYPANGMYLITKKGAVVFDSPWDTTQFKPLADSIQKKHHTKIVMCIATHFHEDRTAGLEYYKHYGANTYTTIKTDSLSQLKGKRRSQFLLHNDTTFTFGQYQFQTYYPGPGHAPDNIIIWFPKEKILYGGCLVKSTDESTLGNLSDADTLHYAQTIEHVIRKCKNPKFVITGHNSWTSTKSLMHTYIMAKQFGKTH